MNKVSEQVIRGPDRFILGMPRRVLLARVGIALTTLLAICAPWYGIEHMLRFQGYPDRATFEWLQVTRATKRVVLVHMGGPSIRLHNPTRTQLITLDGVYQTPPSTIQPQGDVWAYNGADVALRPDIFCTTYVYFTNSGRVYDVASAFLNQDLDDPEDFENIQANIPRGFRRGKGRLMARDDEYVEIVLDDEDDHVPPGDKAAILRFSADPLSVEGFPDVLVKHLGMVRADAATLCRTSGGIFLEDADPARAKAVAQGLRNLGEDCIVVPTSQLTVLPRPLPIHSTALTAADMGPIDAAGRQDSAPWADAMVMVMADVPHEELRTHTRRRLSSMSLAGVPGMVVGTSTKTTTKRSSTRVCLQIVFDDPLRCYEIDSREFAYSILGDQLQHGSEANIQTLARWFLHACPQVRTNFDRDGLMQTARAELPMSTSKGLSRIARWLVNLEMLAK